MRLLAVLLCFFSFAAYAETNVQSVPFGEKGEAWLVESKNAPIVTLRMAFREAGSAGDAKGKEGRAAMLANLLSEGAGNLNALAFQEALESHAIKLGFGADDDQITVEMETLTEHAGKAFELLGLALAKPRFDDEAVKRVKAQMLAGLKRMEEQPTYVAGRALTKTVFGAHPYANPTEGTVAGIAAITKADLKETLTRTVTSENVRVSVVGDIDAAKLKTLLDTHLAALPKTFRPVKPVPDFTFSAKPETITIAKPIPQTVTLFASAGILRSDKDFYVAHVLNHLLGGGTLTSKLGDEIREKRGLAYYANSNLQVMDHGALFSGSFGTANAQAAQAMQVFRDTLATVQKGEVSEAEIAEAKSYIIGAWPLSLASNDGLANMLQVMQRFGLGKDYLEKRNDYMTAVTREDVLRVAAKLVQPEKLVIIQVGNTEGTKP